MSVKLIQHNVVKIYADFGFFRADCDLNDALLPMQSKLANPVVRICIDSLQQHAVGDYFVSLKPPTVSCEESLQHRYNPLTDELGVEASWEVKTLIRERKKRSASLDAGIYVHVMPSNVNVEGCYTRNSKPLDSEAMSRLGLQGGIVTPVGALAQLRNNVDPDKEIFFCSSQFDVDAQLKCAPFVTNNVGDLELSCTVPLADYWRGVETAVTEANAVRI